jgi:PAS domain S-box-containing protein
MSYHSEPETRLLKQNLFTFLLENIPDQVYFKDEEGRFLAASRAVARYMGVGDPEDLLGKTDFDFWSEETAKEARADERRIMETGLPMVGKIERLVHPDGRVTWDYTTKMPLRDPDGRITGVCGINKDFTAVKKMEDALTEELSWRRICEWHGKSSWHCCPETILRRQTVAGPVSVPWRLHIATGRLPLSAAISTTSFRSRQAGPAFSFATLWDTVCGPR